MMLLPASRKCTQMPAITDEEASGRCGRAAAEDGLAGFMAGGKGHHWNAGKRERRDLCTGAAAFGEMQVSDVVKA